MKLAEKGWIDCIEYFGSLKKGWDGYNGKPIKKQALEKFNNMSWVYDNIITKFRAVGFKDCEIEIVPTPNGNIQFEAENKTTYLEIEIN